MVAAASMPGLGSAPDEQRMLLHDVSWKEYVIFRELFDRPGLRMTYLRGALELMSPSPEHELWKKNIARFIELDFALVARYAVRSDTPQALREFERAIRG